MKNKLIIFILLAGITAKTLGQEIKKFYVGTNPISYALIFPLKEDIKRYTPVVAGNEYGFSLAGGYYLHPRLALETRLALGKVHQVASVYQVHAGILAHPFLKSDEKQVIPLYGGLFVKAWDFHNRLTRIHFYNLSPYAAIGYQFGHNRILVDLRINQTLAILSWTSLEDTKAGASAFFSPWPEMFNILPTLTCTIGYRL